MAKSNPYKMSAGPSLDALIHPQVFGKDDCDSCPCYSTDPKWATKVKAQLVKRFKYAITSGETNQPPQRFFARWETGYSTATEVLTTSEPLAICCLGILITNNHGYK